VIIQQPMLILAGGFGSRLKSVTGDLPKPLVAVNGQPFILYMLDDWYYQGVREFVFLLHYHAQLFSSFLTTPAIQSRYKDARITFICEDEPLGTGGAVKHALEKLTINTDFLLANADTWCRADLHQLSASQVPTIGIAFMQDTSRFGTVHFEGNMVTEFIEKADAGQPGWVSAGLYHLSNQIFSTIGCSNFSLERDVLPVLVKQRLLRKQTISSDMIDIGVPDDFYRFCRLFVPSEMG